MPTRLATEDEELAACLQKAPSEIQREVVLMAARAAAEAAGFPQLLEGLAQPPKEGRDLAEYRDELDEEYFQLDTKARQDASLAASALAAFRRARAVAAIAFLAEGRLDESLYESLHAMSDRSAIRDGSVQRLRSET
ncbi:hypothetical protein DF3PB_220037 [uncultured Defluviicoccus sp.]|uniref:Uncharacterized protein n=1 Tax=metagenome TaxID=256318 RepID=A0A380TCA2_9ZZZZ|nr:hypothetical protein DF3PB_220037 [uncultured Defluviicoccus sp.]